MGIGAALSLNLIHAETDAELGEGTLLASGASGTGLVAGGTYGAGSLSLSATQADLGGVSPVVVAPKGFTPVDPAVEAQASLKANGAGRLDGFEADAVSGAGGGDVGVAGSVALNLIDAESVAATAASARITLGGAVSLTSDSETQTIARALPSGDGASGSSVGIGASVALNIVATRSYATLGDGTDPGSVGFVDGASDVTLAATGGHGVVTQADQGSAGGVAVTPVLALSLISDQTIASIGTVTGGLRRRVRCR